MSIEVERKFRLSSDPSSDCTIDSIATSLESRGATLISRKTFTDTYYDSDSLQLTRQNFWLRTRQIAGRAPFWELKAPSIVDLGNSKPVSGTTAFLELTERSEILSHIAVHVPSIEQRAVSDDQGLDSVLGSQPIVHLTTDRRKYCSMHEQLGEFTVDLDSADSGFAVGEVELMVASADLIPEVTAATRLLCFCAD